MTARETRAPRLVLTCEHADRRIPRRFAERFAGAEDALASHRGWDPGALRVARWLARRLHRPLLATRWSRLLVDANRSPSNPRIWSPLMKGLSREERESVLDLYWRPHREAVEAQVRRAIASGGSAVHVAVHSFTPVLDGVARNADVAFLYDSRRTREAELAARWAERLGDLAPGLRVRFNYPYRGRSDGLTTALRCAHPAARYLGLELEVNQTLAASPGWRRIGTTLAASLAAAIRGHGRTRPR